MKNLNNKISLAEALKKLQEQKQEIYTPDKQYIVTYIDTNGKTQNVNYTPEKEMNIVEIISKFKEENKNFFKLYSIDENLKEAVRQEYDLQSPKLQEDTNAQEEPTMTEKEFKRYVFDALKKDCGDYIKLFKAKKITKNGQWGIYVYGKDILSDNGTQLNGFSWYVPYDNDIENFVDPLLEIVHDEILKYYDNKDIQLVTESKKITEAYEVHNELNPKLWNNTTKELLPEVQESLWNISQEFIKYIDIPLEVADVQFVGSNASYNYNEQSDIDLHLIVNFDINYVDDAILQTLYNAKKNSFNDKYSLDIKGIPVELYIEDIKSMNATLAIYSVQNKQWIKEPTPIEYQLPNVQMELGKRLEEINDVCNGTDEQAIKDLLNNIYMDRKNGLATDGEASKGNVVFKELRNLGKLDLLRDKYYELRSNKLSVDESKSIKTEDVLRSDSGISLNTYREALEILDEFDLFDNHVQFCDGLSSRFTEQVAEFYDSAYETELKRVQNKVEQIEKKQLTKKTEEENGQLEINEEGLPELERPYKLRKRPDNKFEIESSHPYDLTNYSWAISMLPDINQEWKVIDPEDNSWDIVKGWNEALKAMKEIDSHKERHIDRT